MVFKKCCITTRTNFKYLSANIVITGFKVKIIQLRLRKSTRRSFQNHIQPFIGFTLGKFQNLLSSELDTGIGSSFH